MTEKPDLVVALLNAASLDRHLYLVTELMELTPRLIVALNMVDVARQEGMKIDVKALESALNMPVVSMVASKNQGLKRAGRGHRSEVQSTDRFPGGGTR